MRGKPTNCLPTRLPADLWLSILEQGQFSPAHLVSLRDHFSSHSAMVPPRLQGLGDAAQSNILMKAFVSPEKYVAACETRNSQTQSAGPPQQSLLTQFEQELATLPASARDHIMRTGHRRHVLLSDDSYKSDKHLAFALKYLDPGQASLALKVASYDVTRNLTSLSLSIENDALAYINLPSFFRDRQDFTKQALIAWPPIAREVPYYHLLDKELCAEVVEHNPLAACVFRVPFDSLPARAQTPELQQLFSLRDAVLLRRVHPQIGPSCERTRALALALLSTCRSNSNLGELTLPEGLRRDRGFLKELLPLLQNNFLDGCLPAQLIERSLFDDKDFVLLMLQYRFNDSTIVTQKFSDDYDVALRAVQYMDVYKDISERLQADPTIASEYLTVFPNNFGNLNAKAQMNFDVLQMAVKRSMGALALLNPEARQSRDLALRAIQTWDACLHLLDERWQDDRQLVRYAVLKNSINFRSSSSNLRGDENFVIELLQSGEVQRPGDILNFAGHALQRDVYRITKRVEGMSPRRARLASWQHSLFCATSLCFKLIGTVLYAPIEFLVYVFDRCHRDSDPNFVDKYRFRELMRQDPLLCRYAI